MKAAEADALPAEAKMMVRIELHDKEPLLFDEAAEGKRATIRHTAAHEAMKMTIIFLRPNLSFR